MVLHEQIRQAVAASIGDCIRNDTAFCSYADAVTEAVMEVLGKQEPVGTLYDDGCFVWRETAPHQSNYAGWKMALYALPGAQNAPSVPDDVIEQAVNRFLSWKLPKDFHPDGGIVFIPTKGRGYDSPHWPIGTNLFTAEQAREMLRYALAAAPESKP